MKNIAVIGASGAIGSAFVEEFARQPDVAYVCALSRSVKPFNLPKVTTAFIDLTAEASIARAAIKASRQGPLDVIVVATGLLHNDHIRPEKSMRELTAEKLAEIFAINTIGPALVMKYFLPNLRRDKPTVCALLSARVGSIADNQLGGWYAYRASKAALNMLIKTSSIEMSRTHKQALIIGLHPGTVNSKLSQPFQSRVSSEQLVAPTDAVKRMLSVMATRQAEHSGRCYAYDGTEVLP